MRTIRINRNYHNEKQTLGVCSVFDGKNRPIFSGLSIERGDLNNQINISCVPRGRYTVILEYSEKFNRMLWELKDVPGRTEIKFHSSNHWFELRGCISLWSRLLDIDKDGYYDVINSRNTMLSFHNALKGLTRVDLIIS